MKITAKSFTKIDQLDENRSTRGPYKRIPTAPGTNQIAGFVEFRPLTSCKPAITGTFQNTIVQGVCRKNSEKPDRAYFLRNFPLRILPPAPSLIILLGPASGQFQRSISDSDSGSARSPLARRSSARIV